MKNFLFLFTLIFYQAVCAQQQADTCAEGTMQRAWHENGETKRHEIVADWPKTLVIHLDTNRKVSNFISRYESYLRYRQENAAFLLSYEIDDWDSLKPEKQNTLISSETVKSKHLADSIHQTNNQPFLLEVLVLNNGLDSINLTLQDGSFQCVLEAKNKQGEWQKMEYWIFSGCGNSYYPLKFDPQQGSSFTFKIPEFGNFKTQLRFKLLFEKWIYIYSNEFEGKIDPCEFKMDRKTENNLSIRPNHF